MVDRHGQLVADLGRDGDVVVVRHVQVAPRDRHHADDPVAGHERDDDRGAVPLVDGGAEQREGLGAGREVPVDERLAAGEDARVQRALDRELGAGREAAGLAVLAEGEDREHPAGRVDRGDATRVAPASWRRRSTARSAISVVDSAARMARSISWTVASRAAARRSSSRASVSSARVPARPGRARAERHAVGSRSGCVVARTSPGDQFGRHGDGTLMVGECAGSVPTDPRTQERHADPLWTLPVRTSARREPGRTAVDGRSSRRNRPSRVRRGATRHA